MAKTQTKPQTEPGGLFVNQANLFFVALQTLLKGPAVTFNGVCRKLEKQMSGGEQFAPYHSTASGCLV